MSSLQTDDRSNHTSNSIAIWLRRLVALAGLVLMAATWRLWFAPNSFPVVPLLSGFRAWPVWCDVLASGVMVLSLGTLLVVPRQASSSKAASLMFAGGFLGAVLLNQHRLQPWAYEFGIIVLVLALLPPRWAVVGLRLIVASIYLHSGLSKLDVTFLTTHGETLIGVLTNAVGWNFASAPPLLRKLAVAVLPLGEIAVAVGLCFRKSRRLAVIGSLGMHLALLGILGPWGLGHQPGVLIWNFFFIAQNLILFWPADKVEIKPTDAASMSMVSRWRMVCGYGLVAAVVLLPFLEPFGRYDHWPAWAVYASRPERVRVYVAADRIADLPAALQEHVSEKASPVEEMERWLAGKASWREVQIDHWSLAVLDAPIYPQDRFQVGAALALAEKHELGEDIRVERDSPADRWTGKRSTFVLEGTNALRKYAQSYRFNARPRL